MATIADTGVVRVILAFDSQGIFPLSSLLMNWSSTYVKLSLWESLS
jgi:hypothetical protein